MRDFTTAEARYWQSVLDKDAALRVLLAARVPGANSAAMFDYLVAIKTTLGNLNNDISFVAALLVKPFLRQRFWGGVRRGTKSARCAWDRYRLHTT